MSSLPLGLITESYSGTRVHNTGLLEDESITLKTGNVATRVGEGDLVDLIRIKPDFLFSAFENGCREAFLKFEGYCGESRGREGV